VFQSYPDEWRNDIINEDYSLRTLNDDHELYNQHIGCVSRVINDKKEERQKQEEHQKISSLDDVSDLDSKFWEYNMNCYQLLSGEFHPVPGEEMKEHRITKGANCGKTK
jgi:mannose-6-phosphate isomerase class I